MQGTVIQSLPAELMLRIFSEFTTKELLKSPSLVGKAWNDLATAFASAYGLNQSKRKTSNANGQTNLGHKHKAPDHNHEATQPMVDLPHTS